MRRPHPTINAECVCVDPLARWPYTSLFICGERAADVAARSQAPLASLILSYLSSCEGSIHPGYDSSEHPGFESEEGDSGDENWETSKDIRRESEMEVGGGRGREGGGGGKVRDAKQKKRDRGSEREGEEGMSEGEREERRETEMRVTLAVCGVIAEFFECEARDAESESERATLARISASLLSYLRLSFAIPLAVESKLPLHPNECDDVTPRDTSAPFKDIPSIHLSLYSAFVHLKASPTPTDVIQLISSLLSQSPSLTCEASGSLSSLFRSLDSQSLSLLRDADTGETLLHVLCRHGRKDLVIQLIQDGVTPLTSLDGKYPIHAFLENERSDVLCVLPRDGDCDDALFYEMMLTSLSPTYCLPMEGERKGGREREGGKERGGGSLLHYGVRYGKREMCVLLIERGAGLWAKNDAGKNVLEEAIDATEGTPTGEEILQYLLDQMDLTSLRDTYRDFLSYGYFSFSFLTNSSSSSYLISHFLTHTPYSLSLPQRCCRGGGGPMG